MAWGSGLGGEKAGSEGVGSGEAAAISVEGQAGQEPPQSVSVSLPFLISSEQEVVVKE